MTALKVDVDGETNQLFTSDYFTPYTYQDTQRYFKCTELETLINQESFYYGGYCFVLDFRTINDRKLSGIERRVRDNTKLKMTKGVTPANGKAFVYLVTDRKISFANNEITGIQD